MNEKEIGNLITMCKSCGEERKQDCQRLLKAKKLKIEVGDFVKTCFVKKEHMWVKVKSIRSNTIAGKLNNEPIIVPMKLGQMVVVYKEDIEDVITSGDNKR